MIGLFDSGIGGLSILKTLESVYPSAPLTYYADNANFPYSALSAMELERACSKACGFLLAQGVKQIVVACHTASVQCLQALQARFPVPIIGMVEPTLNSVQQHQNLSTVALMATEATLNSNVYQKAFLERYPQLSLIPLNCLNLATQVENDAEDMLESIRLCLQPLSGKSLDALILGCTHYNHIAHLIEEELPGETILINPASLVTQEVEAPEAMQAAQHHLYTTGDPASLAHFLDQHPLARTYSLKKLS